MPDSIFFPFQWFLALIFIVFLMMQCRKKQGKNSKTKTQRTKSGVKKAAKKSEIANEDDHGEVLPSDIQTREPPVAIKGRINANPGFPSPMLKPPAGAPNQQGIADTADPNYQTLCGMDQRVFGQDKAAGGQGGGARNEPKPNQAGGVAGTADPNYQTLCGMGQDVFGNDKAGGAANQPKPNQPGGVAGSADPNYQTLCGMGQDVFGNDKAAGSRGGANVDPKPNQAGGVAGVADPNYQTLAAVGGDVFGKDKKF